MVLNEALSSFLLDRTIKGLSKKTIEDYREFIKPFVKFIGESVLVEDISQLVIRQYIGSLYDRKLSKATIGTYTRHIRVFLSWLAEENAVQYDIAKIPLPKTNKKQVHIFNNEEIRLIFDSVSAESEWMTLRNKACIALMLDSGLRRGEICGVKRADYSKAEHTLTVCGKGEKYRTVPVGRLSDEFIAQYLEACPFSDTAFLFVDRRGKPLTGNALKLLMQKLSGKLPFEFSCHKLRHNFATNYCIDMYEKHGQMDPYSLQILMGHSDMKTTMRYIHHAMSIVASRAHLSHLDLIFSEGSKSGESTNRISG